MGKINPGLFHGVQDVRELLVSIWERGLPLQTGVLPRVWLVPSQSTGLVNAFFQVTS